MKNHRNYDPRTEGLENLAFAQFVDLCDQKDLEDRRQIHRHFFEGFRQKVFLTNCMDFAVEGLSETLQELRPYRVD
jgi:hypothetical protein